MKTKCFYLFRKEFNLIFLFLFLFCSKDTVAQHCYAFDEPEPAMMGGGGTGNPDCNNQVNYAPDTYSPMLEIKVNFHFMQNSDMSGPENFDDTWDGIDADHPMNGDIWAQGVINMMNNNQLNTNPPMNLPPGNSTAAIPYKFRFKLMGVYYHPHPTHYELCRSVTNLDTLVTEYGVNTDSEINVFFTYASDPDVDSCDDHAYVALTDEGKHVHVLGSWQSFNDLLNDPNNTYEEAVGHSYWSRGRLLLHEFGHVLNLSHTMHSPGGTCGNVNDLVSDTPSRSDIVNGGYGITDPCCYGGDYGTDGFQDPNCTNNLMDYSGGYALTPGQLGRFYNDLLNNQINLIYGDYCQNNPNLVTVIPSGENLTWNQTRIFKGDVVIEPQSTVRITCTVYMPIGAKIIVKPGAKLIIDGGTITQRCGGLWQGIEVWGNYNLKQTPESNQGVVEVINDGTIEFASTGIHAIKTLSGGNYDWTKTGGIVKCRDAHFVNNRKSVAFMAYHNYNNNGQIANKSYFRNCDFLITDVSRFPNENHDCFISMWDVNGVKILGCEFKNTVQNISTSQRGNGLFTIQSTYKVGDFCNSIIPIGGSCPEEDAVRSRFENLNYAIRSAGVNGSLLLSIEHAEFIDNKAGIYLAGFGQSQIIRNDFTWHEINNPDIEDTYGIYLEECMGYEVEENRFDANDGDYTFGIAINNSGEYATQIYRNEFKNCAAASMVYGLNRDLSSINPDIPGLEWKCNIYGEANNENSMNQYGISLWNNASQASFQGVLTSSGATGNLFYPDCAPINNSNSYQRELKLLEQEEPSYYDYIHYDGISSEPLCRTAGIGLINNGGSDQNFNLVCPSSISTSTPPITFNSKIGFHRNIYQQLKPTYDGYINNGTGTALATIIRDPSKTSIEVRNALMDAAPRVSDDLLMEVLKRTPALEGWHMAQALLANSPLREAVLVELEKTEYDAFYKNLINNNQPGGISTRLLMAMDATFYRSEQDRAKDDLIRSYAGDYEEETHWPELIQACQTFDYSIRPWQKGAILMEKGDLMAAVSPLTNCSIDPDRCEIFQHIWEIQHNGMASRGLPIAVESQLIDISSNEVHMMRATASLILEFWGADAHREFLALPEGAAPRSLRRKDKKEGIRIEFMNVFPNPANHQLRLSCKVPKEVESATIVIYNSQGQRMIQLDARQANGILELDTTDWPSGLYLADMEADGIKLGTTSIAIIH